MPEESRGKLESVLQNVRTDRRTFLRSLFVGGAGAAAALVPLSAEASAERVHRVPRLSLRGGYPHLVYPTTGKKAKKK